MVQFNPANVFLAVAFFAAKGIVAEEAHALEVFPELKGKGPVDIAYKDPDTHKVVVEEVDENGQGTIQKRSYPVNQDALTKLLRNHNGNGFCKGFCPGYYPKPTTKTSLKTSTKVVQFTTTIVPAPTAVTRTATAQAPADITVTETATISTTSTTTFAADTSTITQSETITESATETTTITETTTLIFPTTTVAPVARALSPPSWLKGYANNLICPACNKVWPMPSPKTVSACKTTTKTITRTKTATKARPTITSVVTITPSAKIVTVSVSTTLTFTDSTTSTPLATTTALQTTQTITTVSSTTTTTLCPQQTANVYGIGVSQPGRLQFDSTAQHASDCCTVCFRTPGCNAWALLGSGFCAYAVQAPPNSGTTDATCPYGKGNAELFVGDPSSGTELAGGPGQCAL
ncbi:hypothetical protein K458DRAFT_487683 [Lentithecium fluviatile CBS 122367]|uniref:Apple domain-containing protein n=1 Tax=Lentithecium fluviatile CBS 122367 TaxID=1168545 RepID=A0A6G1J134_9PLEO|nr:hypothetical protein K458DRAFT_487683 [Lentithecium fluviatile CBS 122367]